MKDRQFSLHSCEFLLCRWKTCAWLGLTTSSVSPELLRHRYDSAQEVTSHERARTRDFNAPSRTPPWLPSGWGCQGAFWGILRQLPVQRVDLLGADVADD